MFLSTLSLGNSSTSKNSHRKWIREELHVFFNPFILFFQKAYLTLASLQRGPGSNSSVDAICGLSLLLIFSFAPRRFSPGTSVLPSPLKPTLSNSKSIWNARTCFNKFLTPRCSVGKQITPKKMAPVVETLDSAIHRRNPYRWETIVRKQEISTADQKDQPNCVIHWIEIYPVDND